MDDLNRAGSASRIRFWLALFILGLLLSGVTVFPLESEVQGFDMLLHTTTLEPVARSTGLLSWIDRVQDGLSRTNAQYPFLAYGTDWLALAHLVIAATFIGPWINPVRNKWVIAWGLIACAAVLPLALIAGPIRGIPFGWRLVDCSFGVFGAVPLVICWREIGELESTASVPGVKHV